MQSVFWLLTDPCKADARFLLRPACLLLPSTSVYMKVNSYVFACMSAIRVHQIMGGFCLFQQLKKQKKKPWKKK